MAADWLGVPVNWEGYFSRTRSPHRADGSRGVLGCPLKSWLWNNLPHEAMLTAATDHPGRVEQRPRSGHAAVWLL